MVSYVVHTKCECGCTCFGIQRVARVDVSSKVVINSTDEKLVFPVLLIWVRFVCTGELVASTVSTLDVGRCVTEVDTSANAVDRVVKTTLKRPTRGSFVDTLVALKWLKLCLLYTSDAADE